jgi:hypothetical protein
VRTHDFDNGGKSPTAGMRFHPHLQLRENQLTKANLAQSITDASTPADHEAIAAFFREEAADANKTADLHQHWADTYRKVKIPKPIYMAEMCDNLAADFRKTATDANKLAAIQEQMAE